MADIVQHFYQTAAAWTAANPILAARQIGWESDTKKAKIGDGTTAWNDIADYLVEPGGGGGGAVTAIDTVATGGASQTVNFNTNRMSKITLTADCTISLTDGASATDHLTGTLQLVQDSTVRTITWGGTNILFPGGIEPQPTAGSGDICEFMFEWNGQGWILTNAIYDVQ